MLRPAGLSAGSDSMDSLGLRPSVPSTRECHGTDVNQPARKWEQMDASSAGRMPDPRRVPREAAGGRVVAIEAADRSDRQQALLLLGLGGPWMVYTHLYFWLHPRGLTVAPSLFMHLTGRPDPLCGLTRTFAWMWRGDVAQAVAVYPLGPVLFLVSFPLLAYAAFVLVLGRALRVRLPTPARRALVALVVLLFALNWASKLLWLGV